MEAMVTADMATPDRAFESWSRSPWTRAPVTLERPQTATGTQAKAVGGVATGMPTVLAPVGGSHPLARFGFAIERAEERPMLSR
jgi:hypothetical protein